MQDCKASSRIQKVYELSSAGHVYLVCILYICMMYLYIAFMDKKIKSSTINTYFN